MIQKKQEDELYQQFLEQQQQQLCMDKTAIDPQVFQKGMRQLHEMRLIMLSKENNAQPNDSELISDDDEDVCEEDFSSNSPAEEQQPSFSLTHPKLIHHPDPLHLESEFSQLLHCYKDDAVEDREVEVGAATGCKGGRQRRHSDL